MTLHVSNVLALLPELPVPPLKLTLLSMMLLLLLLLSLSIIIRVTNIAAKNNTILTI